MKIITDALHTKGFTNIDDFLPINVAQDLIKIYSNNLEWKRQEQVRPDHYKHVFKFESDLLPSEDEEYRAKFWRWDYEKGSKEIDSMYREHFKPSIESYTKKQILDYEISCMKMEKGDYYRVHLDGWQGKLNTIYYLNTDWKWDWGGLLHVVKDNDESISETIMPKFNRMVILNNEKFRSPHFVTTVNEYSLESRSTLCSWIKEIEDEK